MSDDAQKKYTVKVAPDAFKNVPEEDRAALMTELEKIFAGISVGDPLPGQPVLAVPRGTRLCPECGGPLEEGPVLAMPDGTQQVLDCEACDRGYIEAVETVD